MAQGIEQGLAQFQRDSAGIAAIHNQLVDDIQAQARMRAQEREQRATEAREAAAARRVRLRPKRSNGCRPRRKRVATPPRRNRCRW